MLKVLCVTFIFIGFVNSMEIRTKLLWKRSEILTILENYKNGIENSNGILENEKDKNILIEAFKNLILYFNDKNEESTTINYDVLNDIEEMIKNEDYDNIREEILYLEEKIDNLLGENENKDREINNLKEELADIYNQNNILEQSFDEKQNESLYLNKNLEETLEKTNSSILYNNKLIEDLSNQNNELKVINKSIIHENESLKEENEFLNSTNKNLNEIVHNFYEILYKNIEKLNDINPIFKEILDKSEGGFDIEEVFKIIHDKFLELTVYQPIQNFEKITEKQNDNEIKVLTERFHLDINNNIKIKRFNRTNDNFSISKNENNNSYKVYLNFPNNRYLFICYLESEIEPLNI